MARLLPQCKNRRGNLLFFLFPLTFPQSCFVLPRVLCPASDPQTDLTNVSVPDRWQNLFTSKDWREFLKHQHSSKPAGSLRKGRKEGTKERCFSASFVISFRRGNKISFIKLLLVSIIQFASALLTVKALLFPSLRLSIIWETEIQNKSSESQEPEKYDL